MELVHKSSSGLSLANPASSGLAFLGVLIMLGASAPLLELAKSGTERANRKAGSLLPQWVASIVKEEWTNKVFDVELMKDASAIKHEPLNTVKLALHCVDSCPLCYPWRFVARMALDLDCFYPKSFESSGELKGRWK